MKSYEFRTYFPDEQIEVLPEAENGQITSYNNIAQHINVHYYYYYFSHAVRLSPPGAAAALWPIIPAPDDRCWWLWSNRWNANLQGKSKYPEKTCPRVTLLTTNPTWPDPGSNPDGLGGKPSLYIIFVIISNFMEMVKQFGLPYLELATPNLRDTKFVNHFRQISLTGHLPLGIFYSRGSITKLNW
jgi:hypothetical protein